MRLFFLLLFIAVPLAELALLIKVGELIGVLPTIALVIATAVIGVALLKRQGLKAFNNARTTLDRGELPVESVIDAVCLLVAGAFLLTPGLITDTAGFLLLVPSLRRGLAYWVFSKLMASPNVHVRTFGTGGRGPGGPDPGDPHGRRPPPGGPVIEGEYEDVDKKGRAGESERADGGRRSPWRK